MKPADETSSVVETAIALPVSIEEDDKSYIETAVSPDILQILENHLPEDSVPNIHSSEWTKYVLSLFHKSELVQGYPTCNGLRRVFETLIGDIINSDMEVLQCPDPQNGGRATVKCTIKYRDKDDGNSSPLFAAYGRSVSDVADCFYGNTDKPYCDHPVATAATLAEGRALRKGLRLNIITSEEASKVNPVAAETAASEIKDSAPMTGPQKTLILRTSAKLGIHVQRTLDCLRENKKIPESIVTLDSMNYEEAQSVIRSIQNLGKDPKKGGEIIPESLFLTPEEKKAIKS